MPNRIPPRSSTVKKEVKARVRAITETSFLTSDDHKLIASTELALSSLSQCISRGIYVYTRIRRRHCMDLTLQLG